MNRFILCVVAAAAAAIIAAMLLWRPTHPKPESPPPAPVCAEPAQTLPSVRAARATPAETRSSPRPVVALNHSNTEEIPSGENLPEPPVAQPAPPDEGKVENAGESPKPPAPQRKEVAGLALAFGEFTGIDGIANADWSDLAGTHADMCVGWTAIVKNYLKGGPTDGDAWATMMRGYNKLQDFGANVRGKLPSHVANKNGELTHPLIMANLLAAELEKAGCRLSEGQKNEIAALGEDFELRWKRRQGFYTDMTLRLEKVIDEADLKQRFLDGMLAVLTQAQRNVAVDPHTQGIFCAELYNAGILLHCQCEFIPADTRAQLKESLLDRLAALWNVERKALEVHGWILDTFLDQLSGQVAPQEPGRWAMAWTTDIIIYGRAFADMLQRYHTALDVDAKTKEAMRQNAWFFIPRIPR